MNKVSTTIDKLQVQSNLDILVSWSEKWQMKFNVDKCKVLHINNNNQYTKYKMNGSTLFMIRDLGVTISNDLKPRKHCSYVDRTANKLVGFIRRNFKHKSKISYPYTIQCTRTPLSRILHSIMVTIVQWFLTWVRSNPRGSVS